MTTALTKYRNDYNKYHFVSSAAISPFYRTREQLLDTRMWGKLKPHVKYDDCWSMSLYLQQFDMRFDDIVFVHEASTRNQFAIYGPQYSEDSSKVQLFKLIDGQMLLIDTFTWRCKHGTDAKSRNLRRLGSSRNK